MSPVEAFVQKLSRQLEGRLTEETLEARLRETRAHLRMSAEEVGDAEAIARYGTPRATAHAILRQAHGYDSRSPWALSWGVGLSVAAAFAIPYVWMERATVWTDFQAQLWLPFLAVMLFAARCLRTRRWLVLPATAWAAAGIATIFVVSALLPARLSPSEAAKEIEWARTRLAASERDARDVAAWLAGRPPLDSAPYAWKPNGRREVAGLPVPIPMDAELVYQLERFEGPQPLARAAWLRHGNALARAVAKERAEASVWLAAKQAGYARPAQPLGMSLGLWATASAQIATVLLAFNALALLLGRAVDGGSRPRAA